MGDGSDSQLTRGLAAGDEDAFAEAYDRFAPSLYAAACGLLRSPADAEDAVADVWAALARGRQRLANVRNLRAYLFTALRHAAARRRHDRPREASLDDVLEPATPAPAARDDRLERALRSLPPEQREAVVLKIDGGLTFAELGEALGVSPNTAASRYRYALEKLRDILKASDDGNEPTP